MGIFGLFKLVGILLLTTCGLCWVLTSQSFLDPFTSVVVFAAGILGISVAGMNTIDFWD